MLRVRIPAPSSPTQRQADSLAPSQVTSHNEPKLTSLAEPTNKLKEGMGKWEETTWPESEAVVMRAGGRILDCG